jgi:hypothetical protein
MAVHCWSIHTPEPHVVEVQHAVHSARLRIKVDGETVFSQDGPEALSDTGFCHEFVIDGRRCRLSISGIGSSPEYDLQVGFWPYIGTSAELGE